MKHNKIFKSLLAFAAAAVVLTSCTEWLSVDPEDQVLEDQAFESLSSIHVTLNGLYLKMSEENAYGFQMTSGTADLLAQYYSVSGSDNFWAHINGYKFDDESAINTLAKIWKQMYNLILDANFFIQKLNATQSVISPAYKNLLMGEAYAIRAYAHLDLLRMFGPVYSKYPDDLSIPYYREAKPQVQDRLPAVQVIDEILADIDAALEYLDADPVKTEGRMVGPEYSGDFYAYRSWRLNFYAVKALKARTLMYAGKKDEAAILAEQILAEIEDDDEENAVFPWVKKADIDSHLLRDYCFSTEVLFGNYNYWMIDNFYNYFSLGITEAVNGMFSARTNVNFWFNVGDFTTSNDYRAIPWKSHLETAYAGSVKFANQGPRADDVHFYQPMIRKTELYYILAEARSDVSYLNTIRTHRGVLPLASFSTAELNRDCMAEFWGEGQLFYHYKRRNEARIRNGATGANLTMNDNTYQVPIPQAELEQ